MVSAIAVMGSLALLLDRGIAAGSNARPSSSTSFAAVRWRVIPLPPLCGAHRTIQMVGSPIYSFVEVKRLVVHPAWMGYSVEDLSRSLVPTVGPLLGTHRDAAVDTIECSNTGGTVDGTLATKLVIYIHRGTHIAALAVLPTTVRIYLPEIATFATVLRIKPDQITVRESFYGSGDASCCSTGRAITVWNRHGGWLVPHTRIVRLPSVDPRSTKTEPRSWVRIDRSPVRVLEVGRNAS